MAKYACHTFIHSFLAGTTATMTTTTTATYRHAEYNCFSQINQKFRIDYFFPNLLPPSGLISILFFTAIDRSYSFGQLFSEGEKLVHHIAMIFKV
ncbi:hypothetical protein DERF_014195 [Dermatophagoides farinae]|uniref:Uncharacterized protein n=1 Tax=Dermatophagoides farinae TaxID=6954 RepID=A0A922KTV2_DERFA|nr:hypothetical protein DERF_014195 [Dermatophagoides farinae]